MYSKQMTKDIQRINQEEEKQIQDQQQQQQQQHFTLEQHQLIEATTALTKALTAFQSSLKSKQEDFSEI